jgi:nucleotide-binding universal stress UspA family protein
MTGGRPSIVVGTDGSDTAREAVAQAGRLAAATGASVHVVTAFGAVAGGGYGVETFAYVDPRADAERIASEAADGLRGQGVQVEVYPVMGEAAGAIIDVAETQRATLVEVGSRGMRAKRRYLLGSVPDRVSHHAPCSVLIVRTGDDAAGRPSDDVAAASSAG